jgi:subtilisin family serine protease
LNKFFGIFIFLIIWSSIGISGIGKLGPRIGRLVLSPERAETAQPDLFKGSDGQNNIQVVVTHNNGLRDIRNVGGSVICSRGDIAVVSVPLNKLEAVSNLPSVIYVESPLPAQAQLDQSTVQIQARKVQNQRGVLGRNVIVGLIDSGIDFWHHDFRNADGSTRIKYLLDLSTPGPIYGGTVFDENDINTTLDGGGNVNQNDVSGHGSHVAGIAAGDGSTNSTIGVFAGVAPGADLVIVKATRDQAGAEFLSTDQIKALTFIDSVAAFLNQPYVANLSLGGHNGAHDGTSVVERFIDSLVGAGKPGKVVVTVAGNDGDADIHAAITFSASSNANMSFQVDSYFPQIGAGNDMIVLSGWYNGGASIGVTLISPSGTRYGPVLPSNIFDQKTDNGSIYIWNGYYDNGSSYQNGLNPFNGDREFYVQIYDEEQDKRPASGEWRIEYTGTGATVDVWIASATMGVNFVNGKSDVGKISIPGTARNAITAAAYISKKNWYDLDGNHLTFDSENQRDKGDISDFSSPGPVRKGGYQKPDIAAPGQIIASTYSSQALPSSPHSIFAQTDPRYPNALINQDGDHGMNSGTSMAAPHVTGAVALILEQSPNLTALQIREMLVKSTRTDEYVGSTPNNSWGWGKLDVFNALQINPGEETPTKLQMFDPAPNPFLNQTRITYELPLLDEIGVVRIVIYNAIGQQVRVLVEEEKNVGSHIVYWDGRDSFGSAVGSGVYLLQMKFGNSEIVKKVVFLSRNK